MRAGGAHRKPHAADAAADAVATAAGRSDAANAPRRHGRGPEFESERRDCPPQPRGVHVAAMGVGPEMAGRGMERARGGMSASAAARRAAEAAGRAPAVLDGSGTCSKAGDDASCTHRESGQSDDVSGTAVCASARSVCRRAAVCLRCARVPRKRVGWRGASAAAVSCAHLAAAEVARAHTEDANRSRWR